MPGRPSARWWGWGIPSGRYDPGRADRVIGHLRARLGPEGPAFAEPVDPPRPDEVDATRLDATDLDALRSVVGAGGVSVDPLERVRHSFGRSLVDELALRTRSFRPLADGVVTPSSTPQVEGIVGLAAARDLALVPWGAGSSVVGGVRADAGSHRAVLALSLERLDRLVALETTDRLATFEAGILGPDLESALHSRGFTLGQFPQSFEHSTLGGWVVTRASGQASTLYGDAAGRVVGATFVTPRGVLRFHRPVHEASGPRASGLFPGSEGVFGVLTEVTVRVEPVPASTEFRAALLPDWDSALATVRALATAAVLPAVLRASDREETELTLAARSPASGPVRRVKGRIGDAWVRRRRAAGDGPTLLVVSYEGDAETVGRGLGLFRDAARRAGGLSAGTAAGEEWRRDRFRLPYLRETLLSNGWIVETVETGAMWSRLAELRRALRTAVERAGASLGVRILVGCHVSHPEPSGASLYATVLLPSQGPASAEVWSEIKHRVTESIVAAGGSVSHHHGVGVDHRAWVERGRAALELSLLERAKRELDPDDLMNPGKTLGASVRRGRSGE